MYVVAHDGLLGKGEVFWGCNDIVASESVPDGFKKKSGLSSMKLKSENGAPKNPSSNQLIYNYWYKNVEVYSAKQLTNSLTNWLQFLH